MEQIGQEGKTVNLSRAGRALNLEPDRARVKRYDIYATRSARTSLRLLAAALVCLFGSIFLFSAGRWILGILVLVLALVCGFLFLLFRGLALGSAYESGLLVPGVVVETNPIKLSVLAPMNNAETEDDESDYGMKVLTIPQLPMHILAPGTRVPCVAMFSAGTENGLYTNFEPRPVSWGFGDEAVIERAIAVIDEREWAFLDRVKNAVAHMPDDQVAYFDRDGALIEVR